MSTIILDVGGLALDVAAQRGGFAAPDLVGAVLRSESGIARSFIRAELANHPLVFVHLTKEEALVIRQLLAKGNQFVCQGEVLLNELAEMTVWGEITGEMIQGGTWWELSVVLHEVSNADTAAVSVDPPSVSTLVNWYDAQGTNFAALSLGDDDPVDTVWPDETANGYDAPPGNPSFPGTLATTALNGHPGVYLTALGNNQRGYGLPNDFSPTEGEAFIVLRAGNPDVDPLVNGGGPFWNFGEITTGPSLPNAAGLTMRDNFGSTTTHSFTLTIDPTEPFLYHVRSRAGQFRAWVNGTLVYSSAINAMVWPPSQNIGMWLSGGAFYQSATLWIGEAKFYQGFKTPTAAAAEEVAIMAKWDIP